jgi:hypothetical protein
MTGLTNLKQVFMTCKGGAKTIGVRIGQCHMWYGRLVAIALHKCHVGTHVVSQHVVLSGLCLYSCCLTTVMYLHVKVFGV